MPIGCYAMALVAAANGQQSETVRLSATMDKNEKSDENCGIETICNANRLTAHG